jgi:hypothetical protein
MPQGRSIVDLQQVAVYMDVPIRVDAKEVQIVRSVVQHGHGNPVPDEWLASFVAVGENMGCVQKSTFGEST